MLEKIALVTGSCGFMGRRMVEILKETKRYLVVGTDLKNPSLDDLYAPDSFIQADLACDEDVAHLGEQLLTNYGRIDVIFDIKGLFDFSASYDDLFDANILGTVALYERVWQLALRPRIITWGAAGVYRYPKGPISPDGVTEDWPTEPKGNYFESKAVQEEYALGFWQTTGIPVTVIRPSGVYGPGARYGIGLTIIMAGKGMMGPIAPNTGKRRGSTVHVDDVCGAALFLAEQPEEKVAGEIFNVCDNSTYTTDEITRFIGKTVGFSFLPWLAAPLWLVRRVALSNMKKAEKLGRQSLIHKDMTDLLNDDALMSSKKLQMLGWRPEYWHALAGLKETIRWYGENGFFGAAWNQAQSIFNISICVWCIAFVTLPFPAMMIARTIGHPANWTAFESYLVLTAILCVSLATGWLSYRMLFVRAGFKNLDNWSRPKRTP